MEHGPAFDMWRDYLGLAAVLAALPRERGDAGEAAAADAPDSASASPGKSLCAFCKHNGEAKHVYSGHSLRDAGGRVQCPVLRSYVCPQCGATQDRAHTKRFCPLTRRGYTSVYSRSARNSAGKRAAGGQAAPGTAKK
ncbi:nanos homolog 3 isoform X2 [Mycteria americana]|uniref:nanos homolog 3 isoform X2 n=1 Tax=Mycteria americana TaxID=33587 RepID=UPI003F58C733